MKGKLTNPTQFEVTIAPNFDVALLAGICMCLSGESVKPAKASSKMASLTRIHNSDSNMPPPYNKV